jgi:hypothetical protein
VTVGQVRDFRDAPPAWLPQLAVTFGNPGRVGVRVSATGLGPGNSVSSAMGSAHVDRAMLTLGLVHAFRSEQAVQPLVGLAAGVHYVSARGTANPSAHPQPAYDAAGVSAIGTASAGIAVALGPRVAVLVEADVILMAPTIAVRIVDSNVATIENPSLFAHAGLLAAF